MIMKNSREKVEQANKLREKYQRIINTGGIPNVKIKDLRAVYGKRLDSPRGCLSILYHIFKSGTYSIDDRIFHAIDGQYCTRMKRAKKSKGYNKHKEEYKKLRREYEMLLEMLIPINEDYYIRHRTNKKSLSLEGQAQQIDIDNLEPSDNELRELESEE